MARKKTSRAAEAARRVSGRSSPSAPPLDVDDALARADDLVDAPAPEEAPEDAALDELRGQLRDENPEVRARAAIALARRGDGALLAAITKNLRHPDARVAIGAAVALGRIADPRVTPNLLEAFKTDDRELAAAVAWALGRCGDPVAVPWLIAALQHDVAPASCCEALGALGDPRAVPALLEALPFEGPSTRPRDVRAHAARALGRVRLNGDEAATRTAAAVVSALRASLRDPARRVRLCAALSLYDLGERSGADEVREVLERP